MLDVNKLIKVQEVEGKTCGLAFITPEQAKQIIENNANPKNRKINAAAVLKYKADMETGNFAETTLICFNEEGMLQNGHNRLKALAQAYGNVDGQWFVVLIGAKNDRCIFDRGCGRTTAQTINMQEGTNITPREVGIARMLVVLEKYGKGAYCGRDSEISDIEIQDYIANNYEYFEALKSVVSLSALHTRKAAVAAGLIQAVKAGVDLNVIETFAKVLNEGYANGQNESAAITLRKQIESDYHASGALRFMFERATEEAILAFATGTPRKRSFEGRKAPYSDMVANGCKAAV